MVQNIQIEQVFEQAIPVYRAFTSAVWGFAVRFPGLLITDFGLDWSPAEVLFTAHFHSQLMGDFSLTASCYPTDVLNDPTGLINDMHARMQSAAVDVEAQFKAVQKVVRDYVIHIR